jgi:hypothetical protein
MMEPSTTRSKRDAEIRGFLAWTILALSFAGYPLAWILFSPKSVLRSTDPEFVNGFGTGAGMTAGMILGGVCVAVVVARLAGHVRRNRVNRG